MGKKSSKQYNSQIFSFLFKTVARYFDGKVLWYFKGKQSSLRQFLATESSLKVMKNVFYFTSKALFVLKIFKFLSWLFGHVEKRLDKKGTVNLKFYNVTGWLTIVIHLLQNISRSKGNQTTQFGPSIECNMRNIFHEKSYRKCDRETSSRRPFSEKLKLSICLRFYTV